MDLSIYSVMRRRLTRALGLMLCCSGLGLSSAQAADDVIHIGAVAPLSSPGSYQPGQPFLPVSRWPRWPRWTWRRQPRH
jgi:hypothetical protein